jgi:hypothetical protein
VRQPELELIAREIRTSGFYFSRDKLLTFSEDVAGMATDASQALLRST